MYRIVIYSDQPKQILTYDDWMEALWAFCDWQVGANCVRLFEGTHVRREWIGK